MGRRVSPGHYQVAFTSPLPVGDDLPGEQMPGQKAWEHFVEGVAPCIGRTPDDPEAARTALLLWQQLHGTVSLRISRPRFPWPPLAETVTEAVTRLTTPAALPTDTRSQRRAHAPSAT
jgi:hypothetical protein